VTPFAPVTPPITRGRDWTLDALWLLIVVGVSSAWCVTAANQLGATFDEPFYLAQGLEFWRTGSHARLLSKGTMPLAVDLTTFPLYLWERWGGFRFDLVGDFDRVLVVARVGTLVFWWLLLGYGWLVGRLLGGPWGGRLAIVLLAAEPSLLGHASLATTDIAVTACLMALVYHGAVGREAGWWRRVAIPAVWYAAAVLAKASGLVFGPLCLVVVEVERLARAGAFRSGVVTRSPWERLRHAWRQLRPFRRDLVRIMGLGLVLVFVYCGSDWSAEPSFVAWAQSLPDGPTGQTMRWIAEHLRIFTNAGQGLVKQIQHNIRGHSVFLLGEARPRAFWYYFPVALSIKMTLTALLLPLAVAVIHPRALRNWAVLAALVLLVFSLTSRVQIGVRMVLPMVALGLVGVAASVATACRELGPGWRRRLLASGAVAGVVWTVFASALVWPHGLCYANELWGGTENGYLHLSDSNYDWGQGLPELARWQRSRGGPPVDVWYFGTDPALKQLPVRELPLHVLPPIAGPEDLAARVQGRYLAVGTTELYGAYQSEERRRRLAFLRARPPVGRTTTFLIYDFPRDTGSGMEKRAP
jgi:hypothetical protein